MNPTTKILITLLLPLLVISCRKDEDLNVVPPVDLGGETSEKTAIDQWLLDSLTTPYNIAVKYRWDPWELNLDKTLTPPDESKIIPAMSAIKRVWIDPYNAETGSDLFMKKYSPKQFKLVGSVEYNYNGTVLLGQAEGGNNIAFFDINQNFDQDPVTSIKRMIQTSHHEFAHILHQNVMYPQEFKGISSQFGKAGYTATWFNVTTGEALANGYITPYSMASSDEDFVEMIANMLMEGRTRFNEIVASTDSVSQIILRRKEQYVVNYFKEVWNIDFYSLQNRVQTALYNTAPPPDVDDLYGFDKQYSMASVSIDPVLLPHSQPFLDLYNESLDSIAEHPGNFEVDSFGVVSIDATTMYLAFFMKQNGSDTIALYGYDVATTSGGVYNYAIFGADDLGMELQNAFLPLLAYFENNQFRITWHADPNASLDPRVKFTPTGNANAFFIGRLVP